MLRHFPVVPLAVNYEIFAKSTNHIEGLTWFHNQAYMRTCALQVLHVQACLMSEGLIILAIFRYSSNSNSHHSAFKRGKNCLLRPGGEGKPFWPEIY